MVLLDCHVAYCNCRDGHHVIFAAYCFKLYGLSKARLNKDGRKNLEGDCSRLLRI
jgi:hypothetical protein